VGDLSRDRLSSTVAWQPPGKRVGVPNGKFHSKESLAIGPAVFHMSGYHVICHLGLDREQDLDAWRWVCQAT
jgi:hypothetical protein